MIRATEKADTPQGLVAHSSPLRACLKILLPLILILFSAPSESDAQAKGSEWLGIRGSRLGFSKNEVVQNYGIEMRIFVADRIALNYSLTFGADHNQQFYMHSYLGGGGAGVLGAAALADSSEGLAALKGIGALISLFIPEGVTFSIPMGDRTAIDPYIEPLGFDVYNGPYETDLFVSGKVGARLKFYASEKLTIQPYGGVAALYSKDLPLAHEFGLSLNYRVGSNKE